MYFMENNNFESRPCNNIIYWSIIGFSAQNIIFYIYWQDLIDMFKSLIENRGII